MKTLLYTSIYLWHTYSNYLLPPGDNPKKLPRLAILGLKGVRFLVKLRSPIKVGSLFESRPPAEFSTTIQSSILVYEVLYMAP